MKFSTIKIVYLSVTLSLCVSPVMAEQLTIASAGNFLPALKEISGLFEKNTGHEIRIVSGSTGSLYSKIIRGAPYDIFLAADSKTPAMLESKGLVDLGVRFTYATGQLVLWSREPLFSLQNREIKNRENELVISMANPLLAPYGVAAETAIEKINIPDNAKIIRGESVGDAFRYVYSGAADMGFVAFSQISLLEPTKKGFYWLIPSNWYKPIDQQAALLKNTNSPMVAKAFLNYLKSPTVQLMLNKKFNYKSKLL